MTTKLVTKNFRFPPLPTIREIIKMYDLKAVKQLSQNFLLDPNLNNKIIKCCGPLGGAEVCEVGPGPGNLTRPIISKGAAKVHLIEKDPRFIPSLQMLSDVAPDIINLVTGDVLLFDMTNLFSEDRRKTWDAVCPNIHIVGNLPFNISTPLIIKWLKNISTKSNAWSYGRVRMTLAFQKEVAMRMVSPIMSVNRCRLSVMCQNWCETRLKLIIPGKAFLPQPKVDVGIVHFVPRKQPIIPLPFELVEKVVRAIFRYRQKYVVRGIETLFPIKPAEKMASELLEKTEISQQLRSFQLSNVEIGKLCFAYKTMIDANPSLINYDRCYEDKDWISKERDSEKEAEQFERKVLVDDFYV